MINNFHWCWFTCYVEHTSKKATIHFSTGALNSTAITSIDFFGNHDNVELTFARICKSSQSNACMLTFVLQNLKSISKEPSASHSVCLFCSSESYLRFIFISRLGGQFPVLYHKVEVDEDVVAMVREAGIWWWCHHAHSLGGLSLGWIRLLPVEEEQWKMLLQWHCEALMLLCFE